METVFRNEIKKPLVSLILLDWSCRESFHSLRYLNQQTVARDTYEILWIEYYSRKAPQIAAEIKECEKKHKPSLIDRWVVIGMPDNACYHKHLMYNIGIVKSKGDIIVICDSDAIFSRTFIETIIKSFKKNPAIVLHFDEVRNNNKKFYPFSYPTIKEVLGDGCVNWKDGKTTGLWDKTDFIHTRNYGACMAAKREDLIAIGGADEHTDYIGHVCGPYEMTFRMVNRGRKELWHEKEFLYHTWHPGQAGDKNYVGPHDGRLISTTALEVLKSGRIMPLLENESIKMLRTDNNVNKAKLEEKLIDTSYIEGFTLDRLSEEKKVRIWYDHELIVLYKEFNILKYCGNFYGVPAFLNLNDLNNEEKENHPTIIKADTQQSVKDLVDQFDISYFRPKVIGEYKEVNLVRYGCRIYPISKTTKEFNLHRVEERRSLARFSATSIETVKDFIDKLDESIHVPVLMGSYKNYNMIRYIGVIYALLQSLGKVDFTPALDKLPKNILSSNTQEDLKLLIDQQLLAENKTNGL